jgi:hypothetical protein
VNEPDGDPVLVVATALANGPAIPPWTALPGGAGGSFTPTAFPATYSVTLDDGTGPVTTTSSVTGRFCAEQGQVCTF